MNALKKTGFFVLGTFFLFSCTNEDLKNEDPGKDKLQTVPNSLTTTLYLTADTYLRPSGTETYVLFLHGTQVTLDGAGKVLNGTLVANTYLLPPKEPGQTFHSPIEFIKFTPVTFIEGKGVVSSGTLAQDTWLKIPKKYANPATESPILFRLNTKVDFMPDENARVISGTLANDTYLFPPNAYTSLLFSKWQPVNFDSTNGSVIKGWLAQHTDLRPAGAYFTVLFSGLSPVTFSPTGISEVTVGTLKNDTALSPLGSFGNQITFKAGTQATFAADGKVQRGTLRYNTYLTISGTNVQQLFYAGTQVTFNNEGMVTGN